MRKKIKAIWEIITTGFTDEEETYRIALYRICEIGAIPVTSLKTVRLANKVWEISREALENA